MTIIHILPNISRSKNNQAIEYCQLIDYKGNIFLKKSFPKYVGESSPRPFFKN